MYYLLFAETNAGYYDDPQMEAIMTQFIRILDGNGLVSANSDTHVISPGSSETFDFTINNSGLPDGTYNTTVAVNSNDPTFTDLEIDVTVHIDNSSCTDFEYNVVAECTGSILFTDLSSSNPSAWSWDFGDGSTPSTEANPIHSYMENGTYNVVLTTTNSFGPAIHESTVTVENLISAEVQYSTPAEINAPINFEATVPPGAITYSWDFGDGNTSTEANPSHTYTSLGSYTVLLTVTNTLGCQALSATNISILASGITEIEGDISIYPNPTAGELYIKNTGSEIYNEIEVVNTIGQVVKRIDVGEGNPSIYSLDLIGLAPGVYVIGVHFEGEGRLRRKIVIE